MGGWECLGLPPIAKAYHDMLFEGEGVSRDVFLSSATVQLYLDRTKFNKQITRLNKIGKTETSKLWDFQVCMVYHKNYKNVPFHENTPNKIGFVVKWW